MTAPLDSQAKERWARLCRMTDEMLNNLTPQERHRITQTQMAKARTPMQNALLMRQMTDFLLNARLAAKTKEPTDDC